MSEDFLSNRSGVSSTSLVLGDLRDSDRVFGAHRSHAHFLAVTSDLHGLFAEIVGKGTGVSRGSRHLIVRVMVAESTRRTPDHHIRGEDEQIVGGGWRLVDVRHSRRDYHVRCRIESLGCSDATHSACHASRRACTHEPRAREGVLLHDGTDRRGIAPALPVEPGRVPCSRCTLQAYTPGRSGVELK